MRKLQVAIIQEEVPIRRIRDVNKTHHRSYILFTVRIGISFFVAYPGGSRAHISFHNNTDSNTNEDTVVQTEEH